ncbi:MAG TPA: ABC transporter substrate-binding protein [Kiloniellales bacterium]|nr:ABC transporter substrate-binding protein [Kiloniellales bacterium]
MTIVPLPTRTPCRRRFQADSALRAALGIVALLAAVASGARVAPAQESREAPTEWPAIVAEARGQSVFWNAWDGDERINAYIGWVGERVAADFGITLRHVKLADTADAVSRVLAEKAAGRTDGGSVDLIWINGENFAAMKENGLLFGPFTERLPNYDLVDFAGKPTTRIDFTVPVEGLEAPWGMAKINFVYDSARVADPPRSIPGFLDWVEANPGRFTYPAPPDFIGSTFLKQVLIELTPDRKALQAPVPDEAAFEMATAPLWPYLEALHPHLWRDGTSFPATGSAQMQLLDDGELDIAISFYPADAASLIEAGRLPKSARSFVLEGGTIGNTHFVAIPFNARAKAAAMVVANFLMSPEAQARKQDPAVWGDQTVLAMDKLSAEDRALFDLAEDYPALLSPEALGPTLLEPHPSWMTRIESEWPRRFSR